MLWVKFGLFVLIVFAIVSAVKFLLRKTFKIEKVKKNLFSYNYINDSHRKVDKWVRIVTAPTLMVMALLIINKGLINLYLIAVIILFTLDYGVRAFFELKYSEFPKQAILTIAEMLLVLTAFIIVVQYWIA
ncbi:DUF4181 domain-containing protein [Bacillus sp. SG-1]|uniref:DUF4181 domain-containing protein n=1 Tax=Bacillus sp. SG-1 TaxID=161544 RepID=UPI0005C65A87|nr:DUF4181 domain-containing protein [Bacillus sp. SG-1]